MRYLRVSGFRFVGLTTIIALVGILTGPACAQPASEALSPVSAGEQSSEIAVPIPGRSDPGVYDDRIVFGQSAAFT